MVFAKCANSANVSWADRLVRGLSPQLAHAQNASLAKDYQSNISADNTHIHGCCYFDT